MKKKIWGKEYFCQRWSSNTLIDIDQNGKLRYKKKCPTFKSSL